MIRVLIVFTLDEGVNYQVTDGTSCGFKIEDGQLVEL
jgi:hypothetical protein